MRSTVQRTFSAAASGTQYVSQGGSAGVPVSRYDLVSWVVDHPAATTTVYTVQGSNMTDAEVAAGSDDWNDISPPVGSKSAAEKFTVSVVDVTVARVRLRGVTSAGSGVIAVRQTLKGPY